MELKRGPVDLTPKVSIIEQRIVERGVPGQAGRTIIEKKWLSGGEGGEGNTNQLEYGRRGGPDGGVGTRGPQVGQPLNSDSGRNYGVSPLTSTGLGDSLNSGPLGSALGSGPVNNFAGTSSYPSSTTGQSPLSNSNRYSSVGSLGQSQQPDNHSPQQQYLINTPSNLYESGLSIFKIF